MQNTRYVAVAGRGTVGFYKNPTDAWEKLFLGRVSGTCSSFYLCSAGPAAAQPCLLSWTCFLTAGARLPGNFSWCKTFCKSLHPTSRAAQENQPRAHPENPAVQRWCPCLAPGAAVKFCHGEQWILAAG